MYRFQSKSKIVIYDFLTYFMWTDLTWRWRLRANTLISSILEFCRGTASCSFFFAAKSNVNIFDFTFEQWPDLLMITQLWEQREQILKLLFQITFSFFFFLFFTEKNPKQTQKSNLFYLETAIGSFIRKCRNNLFDLEDSRNLHYKRPLQCL